MYKSTGDFTHGDVSACTLPVSPMLRTWITKVKMGISCMWHTEHLFIGDEITLIIKSE